MANNDNQTPVVDVDFLAKCLGIDRGEIRDYMLQNWRGRYAARVITDAFRPYDIGPPRVIGDIALKNAEAWISRAYDDGKQAGIEMERRAWERKIQELFGIATPKQRY
jgi:hypothetical protein